MMFATQWRYGEWKNYWGFSSEKMEPGETTEETLRREKRKTA